ncbi:MAG: tetratricopeptide repeat protein [Chitinispirillaceae bacterium]|nr:tetratricopeptide repeat protein [Chitinispirillaceae bacterium]
MKKTTIPIITATLFALSLIGCSHITVLRTKELKAQTDRLGVQIDSLKHELQKKQATLDELLRLIRADQQIRFTEIDKRIAELSGSLSESQYRLSKIDEKTAHFQKQLQAKLEAESLAVQAKKEEIQKLLQIASGDFNAGRFDIAISGFQDVASRFPETDEGKEAQFWISECHYAKRDYGEAEKGYLLYIKQNPEGPKICVALYKLGLTYDKQKKRKSKELVWKKLLDKCPDSEEAKLVGPGGG